MSLNGHKKNGIKKLTVKQGRQLFDRQVRQSLNMSGSEFIRQWEKGKFKDTDESEVIRLSMLIPLGR